MSDVLDILAQDVSQKELILRIKAYVDAKVEHAALASVYLALGRDGKKEADDNLSELWQVVKSAERALLGESE